MEIFETIEKDMVWNPIFEWFEQEWLLACWNDKYYKNICPNNYSIGISWRNLGIWKSCGSKTISKYCFRTTQIEMHNNQYIATQ